MADYFTHFSCLIDVGSPDKAARDQAREADVQELLAMWQEKVDTLQKQNQPLSDGLLGFRWQVEELRVSLFAQELKTPMPVSVKRLMKEWQRLNN